jgi:hypothetical protein
VPTDSGTQFVARDSDEVRSALHHQRVAIPDGITTVGVRRALEELDAGVDRPLLRRPQANATRRFPGLRETAPDVDNV